MAVFIIFRNQGIIKAQALSLPGKVSPIPGMDICPVGQIDGIPLRAANSIGLTPHWGAQTFEFEKAADEIPSAGGPRRLSPRPFGPEFENVLIFPKISVNCRFFPLFAGLFRQFPEISMRF